MTSLLQFTVRQVAEMEARFTSVERISYYIRSVPTEAEPEIPDKKPAPNWPDGGAIRLSGIKVNTTWIFKPEVFKTRDVYVPLKKMFFLRLLLLFKTDALSWWSTSGAERYQLWNPKLREDRYCWKDRLWQVISWRVAMATSWTHRGHHAYWWCWYNSDRYVQWTNRLKHVC